MYMLIKQLMYEYTFFEMKKLAMTVANLSSTGSSGKKRVKFPI